ncbi:histidine phosphatase motif-containing protein [Pandoravirus inopinatum]|uniref:Histidine phosphatase motif-containing protein n=1 Tax=Pandoravirus inopinatum TaxID=1605721 RepID=A0A0B5IZG3_9VIRU|nr:histidine phosphatase motif-containing protein [Pandoravirus inopinatum]AJF98288.1 histidine phosphatase motif-containing protein [Pandoravirus inopinatum]
MPSSPSSTPPPPPLLLYIRHGDDHHDARREARYPKHDHPLNREGKARAARMARNLVERYGAPTAVYCSPFKRARQTADIMMDALDDGDRARVTIDPGLSRYFSRREQRRPSVGSDTHEAGPRPFASATASLDGAAGASTSASSPDISSSPTVTLPSARATSGRSYGASRTHW